MGARSSLQDTEKTLEETRPIIINNVFIMIPFVGQARFLSIAAISYLSLYFSMASMRAFTLFSGTPG